MKSALFVTLLIGMFTGCATQPRQQTTQGEDDAKSVRVVIDAMQNATHRFPSQIAR